MTQKYFTGSDQLTLTDSKLEEALRNGSSTDIDSARQDILAKLRVSICVIFATSFTYISRARGRSESKYSVLHKDPVAILLVLSRPLMVMRPPNLIPDFEC